MNFSDYSSCSYVYKVYNWLKLTSATKLSMREIQVALNVLSSKYENIIFIDDFNSKPKEFAMIDFCQPYNMEN